MTIEEIRKNAPSGANGYIELNDGSIRYFDTIECKAYIDGDWYFAIFCVSNRVKPL